MDGIALKITDIKIISAKKIKISIKVWDGRVIEKPNKKVYDYAKKHKEILKLINDYSFIIDPIECSMLPYSKNLRECFKICDEYKTYENPTRTIQIKYEAAHIVNALADYFFKTNYFINPIFRSPISLCYIEQLINDIKIDDTIKKYGKMKGYFDRYFVDEEIELPTTDLEQRKSGYIQKSGWCIQYCFGKENNMEYLDYYAAHHMGDVHSRIYENGEKVDLPTLWDGHYIISSDSDSEIKREEEELRKHNAEVTKLLIDKGFDRFTMLMEMAAVFDNEIGKANDIKNDDDDIKDDNNNDDNKDLPF